MKVEGKLRSILAVALAAALASACTYHAASVNFHAQERAGVHIANAPTLSSGSRSYGEVEVNERDFYFASCDSVAADATRRLLRAARERGGNIVTKVEFRNRGRWSTNPKCRRNLNWAWLVLPMILPVPQSVRVRGEAIYDPELAAVR